MKDCIVVGAGIIGATVAKALRARGADVLLLDANRPMGGTAPSGGHLKPSWFSGMPKEEYIPAMDLLGEVWGMTAEDFAIWPLGGLAKATVYRVDTDLVVKTGRNYGEVTQLTMLNNFPLVHYKNFNGDLVVERTRLLVVATGAWIGELVPHVESTSKQGVSFRVSGKLQQPFIKQWAPYKQVVAHQQRPEEIWIGDGSAIIPKNWDDKRTVACRERCLAALPEGSRVRITHSGLRSYVASKHGPCLLESLGPRAWAAAGAGKSGTISAGWVARQILDRTV